MGSVLSAVAAPVAGLLGAQGAFGSQNRFDPAMAQGIQRQEFLDAIKKSQAGFGNIQTQQQALADALLAQSRGEGPNIAEMQLKQATDRNIQQNAGLIASQKGINPALAARLAAQNAAMAGQTMAGQSGVMRAQQQLASQGQLGGLYGQMGGQELGMQQTLQNALAGQNAGIYGETSRINELNAARARQNAEFGQKLLGGVASGVASGIMPGTLSGGVGGGGGGSYLGGNEMVSQLGSSPFMSQGGEVDGEAHVSGDSIENDTVPAMLSPGEIVIPRSASKDADKAKEFIDHIKKQKKEPKSFGSVLEAHRKLMDRVTELEKRFGGR